MKRLLGAMLLFAVPLVAQTTYTQVTFKCLPASCTSAQFTPSGTLSYTADIPYTGASFVNGTATWDGNTYHDFSGKMTWIGPVGADGKWEVSGTFDNGKYSVSEFFVCFRGSCGTGSNKSGTVVGP